MMEEKKNPELSLFTNDVKNWEKDDDNPRANGLLGFEFMHFLSSEKMTWQEAFSGFNDIKIITYSFGLPYISQLMRLFDTGEVIVNPVSIRADSAELLATQTVVTNFVCQESYLQARMAEHTFHMYVARDIIAHAKLYLLKANDGKTRVIFASANASTRAWDGSQIENYSVCDDPEYYRLQCDAFESVKDLSTDEISYKAKKIKEDGSNIEDIPMIKKLQQVKEAIVIHDVPTEETKYAFTVGTISKTMSELLKAASLRPSIKADGTLFTLEKVTNMIQFSRKQCIERKAKQRTCPQLEIDYEHDKIIINDTVQDLAPSLDEVRSDIHCWLQYIDGFDKFTGDPKSVKEKAWRILVHAFVSPFFAALRYYGSLAEVSTRFFPIYLLLYGPSDNGKTQLLKTVQKLVLGILPTALDAKFFSTKDTAMPALCTQVKGCPILIDDINNSRWRYASDITKGDRWLITQGYLNHPTFLFSANNIESIRPEVSKRLIVIHVNNQLSKTMASALEGEIVALRKKMTNAFCRAYWAKMLPAVQEIIRKFKNPDPDEVFKPDIYKISSTIISDLMTECGIEIPEEFRIFTWNDYMGDSIVSEQAIKLLKDLYYISPEIFTVNENKNELIIDLTTPQDREKLIKRFRELPAGMERAVIGNKIRLNLEKTELYTEIRFERPGLLSRIRKAITNE